MKYTDELQPLVHHHTQKERERIGQSRVRGKPANFCECGCVLVARNDFFEKGKPFFRWRGPTRVIKALNDYMFRIENLCTGAYDDIHATRLKFYSDTDFDVAAIMSHVVSSKTVMPAT